MIAEGHTVGNHTLTHPDMSGISSMEAFKKQLEGVENLYKEATGESMTKFYRPPQGIYSTTNLSMAKELGYKTFFWSLAYVDWYQDKHPRGGHDPGDGARDAAERPMDKLHRAASLSAWKKHRCPKRRRCLHFCVM